MNAAKYTTVRLLANSSRVSTLEALATTRNFGFTSKGEPDDTATYNNLKESAKKTGDPTQEWVSGTSSEGSAVYKEAKPKDAESVSESIKRGAADATHPYTSAEQINNSNKPSPLQPFVETLDAIGNKISEIANTVADKVGNNKEDDGNIESARAVWEATRSDEKKAKEQESVKSKLTDEAFGDDPTEVRVRDDKRILPSDFYTRH